MWEGREALHPKAENQESSVEPVSPGFPCRYNAVCWRYFNEDVKTTNGPCLLRQPECLWPSSAVLHP